MTDGILAVFGLSGGEMLMVLAALVTVGVFLVSVLTVSAYLVIRMVSGKSEAGHLPHATSGRK